MVYFLLLLFGPLTCAESGDIQKLDSLTISTPLLPSTANTALPVSILGGDELRMKAASTIGETLKNEAGISNQSFGPGVGRPVIRGQSGARVQVLQNGLGSLDVSSLSPDHANSTEALLAKQVEVLKGPVTLLYGSGIIGGFVNVLDNRIPDIVPENELQAAVEQRYNTVNEGKASVFKLDGGKNMLAWHLDGFYRDSIDQQIPGNAFKSSADKGSQGRLLNSSTRAYSGTAGFSVVADRGFVGFSVNHLDNNYGVPPSFEPATVRIALQQTRYDMKAEISDPFKFAEKLRVRLVYNDYQHTELENGVAGTVFSHKGFENRVELIQKPWAFFDHGVLGVQTKNSKFSAIGEESLMSESKINSFGFFALQDIYSENVIYELAMRVERQWIDPQGKSTISHTPVSFSASALWNISEEDSIGLTFFRSQRAPDVQELFAFGPHLAIGGFSIGDSSLIEETSYNLELNINIDRDWMQINFNLFQNWVQDYIVSLNSDWFFETTTSQFTSGCTENSCLPVFQSQQQNAEFQGFEAQITVPFLNTEYGVLDGQLFGDYVRGRFSSGDDIPRMPPLRYGMQLSWNKNDWYSYIRVTRAEKQNNSGINETKTAGYWLLDMTANYHPNINNHADVLLFVKANNLLDQDIRNSVSYLRNIAPQASRGVELGIRVAF